MSTIPYIGEFFSICAALSWAVGVILFKRSTDVMPPLSLNFFKNSIGAILLLPTIYMAGESLWPAVSPLQLAIIALSGITGMTIADTLFFVSLEKLGAGISAVVSTAYTPIILIMSFFVLNEPMGPIKLLGASFIFSSLLVGSATKPQAGKTTKDIVVGILIGLLAILFMSFGVIIIKDILKEVPILWLTWFRVLVATVALLPIMLLNPKRRQLFASLTPSVHWKTTVPAGIFGTYIAMTVWILGMKYIDVSRAALLNQLSTVFIFILAIVFLKETITKKRLAAIILALTGAYCVISPETIKTLLNLA